MTLFSYIGRGYVYGLIAKDDRFPSRAPVIRTPSFVFGDVKLLVCNT